LVGSVPVAKDVGAKTTEDVGGGTNPRQRLWWRVALQIEHFGWGAAGKHQNARVIHQHDVIGPEILRHTAVPIRPAPPSSFHNRRSPSLLALATSRAGSEIASAQTSPV